MLVATVLCSATPERQQHIVERYSGELDFVPGAFDYYPRGTDLFREVVANRLEPRAVAAGDHELWIRRGRELRDRYVGFPYGAPAS
jgi:hypothetical protein